MSARRFRGTLNASKEIEEMTMDPQYVLGIGHGHRFVERQLSSPEWQHRAALLDAREPWRSRFGRRAQRWQALAGLRPLPVVRQDAG
jgi:hypothetical protein